MPIWAAIAIAVAAFGLRTVLRGPSFDVADAIVIALFVVVVVVAVVGRRWVAAGDAREADSRRDAGIDAIAASADAASSGTETPAPEAAEPPEPGEPSR